MNKKNDIHEKIQNLRYYYNFETKQIFIVQFNFSMNCGFYRCGAGAVVAVWDTLMVVVGPDKDWIRYVTQIWILRTDAI